MTYKQPNYKRSNKTKKGGLLRENKFKKGTKRKIALGVGLAGLFAFLGYKGKKYFDGQRQLLEEAKKQKIIDDKQLKEYKQLFDKIEKDKKEKELKEVMNSKTKLEAKSRINNFFNYLNKPTSLLEVYIALRALRAVLTNVRGVTNNKFATDFVGTISL